MSIKCNTESTYMFPPSSLICKVTTASPIQTIEKTPEKTRSDCLLEARRERNMLSKRQNISGPLYAVLAIKSPITGSDTYQRSQSLSPSLIPPWRIPSASGHRPTSPLISPPKPWLSPRSAAFMPPPPLCSIPPKRYLGHSTCFIFSHTASRSLDKVAHTLSSIVFCGARRSSPGMLEVR
jgi:hypothetical protein